MLKKTLKNPDIRKEKPNFEVVYKSLSFLQQVGAGHGIQRCVGKL